VSLTNAGRIVSQPDSGSPSKHAVLGTPLLGPWPAGVELAVFGMGCFWGAERLFWTHEGVYTTCVGYAGGSLRDPTYGQVKAGDTGHVEVVRVAYRSALVSYAELLKVFWENHDPTQGMRQGRNVGSQYRSVIFTTTTAQLTASRASRDSFAGALSEAGFPPITTEIKEAPEFYPAEPYHQQHLHKNPDGYCAHGPIGVTCNLDFSRPA